MAPVACPCRTFPGLQAEDPETAWIPAPQSDETLVIYKVCKRTGDDISGMLGAFRLKREGETIKNCRLAFVGMAAIPKRAGAAETALRGKPWDASTVGSEMSALVCEQEPFSHMPFGGIKHRR